MAKRLFGKSHLIVTLITLVIFGVCSFFTTHLTFFNPIKRALDNFYLSDIYYQILRDSGQERKNDLITIVDATQLYDRGRIGCMFEEIAECEPAVVGVDCIYQGFRGDTLGTNRLVEGAFSLDKPIFAVKLKEYDAEKEAYSKVVHSVMCMPGFEEYILDGFTNVSYDNSRSTVRKFVTDMVVNKDTLHSLAYMVAAAYRDDTKELSSLEPQLINYSPTRFNVVPYDSIAEYSNLIKDHVVIVGAMDDDADKHFTPYGLRPGTEIQAYMAQTLIEHDTKRNVNFFVVLLVSAIVIWLTDVMQTGIGEMRKKCKNALLSFLLETALFKNIINLIWIGILVYINFILFAYWDLYFNPAIMLTCIALLVEARLFYDSASKALNLYKEKKAQRGLGKEPTHCSESKLATKKHKNRKHK